MHYFKHAELVNQYHVSLKTVHNWIDAARQGKVELELKEHRGRTYIANTPNNAVALKMLAEQGKKYRNRRYSVEATPAPAFYELFSHQQILDIITNLNVHREIPRQYNYVGEGAINWDKYTRALLEKDEPNLLKNTIALLHENLESIDRLLEGHNRVNVVDVGPGNGLPVKELLSHLLERGILHRYVAIDISTEMLHIAESNIKNWFGDKVKFEGYVRDVSFERFRDVFVEDMLGESAEETINLVLLLGATPMNFPEPTNLLRVIHDSMGYEDLLIYTDRPDSEAVRRHFNVDVSTNGAYTLSPIHAYIFNLLNIDESLYDVEMVTDDREHTRYIRVRFKKALTIKFKFEHGMRHVDIGKGETILLWRVWDLSSLKLIADFEAVGFSLLHAGMTKDRQYLLTISGIEAKTDAAA